MRATRSVRGAALVIVLAFLVLATVLVVAFFGTVTSEYGAAKMTSDVEAGRQLAETTVQIVMGQVRTATTQPGLAWASQPGMIRTYDNGGKTAGVYALYSAAQMARDIGGAGFDPAMDLPGGTWAADRALWVDLNFPSEGRNGGPVFPIIDPRAAGATSGGPILVEGFSYDASVIPGTVAAAGSGDAAARLPMPVRWIYVLRDGSLAVPSGGSGMLATFAAPGPVPTSTNPIVGRIAFWTDDETCKLNINTACGGVPWDTPIGNSGLELLFARFQPAKNEFSRYPGHPASVSLAPVLWSYLGLTSPNDTVFPSFVPSFSDTSGPMTSEPALSAAAKIFRDKLFPLIPRNTFGGSAMSTIPTATINSGSTALSAVDSDRLFASTEEIVFGPGEGGTLRGTNPVGLNLSDVGTLKFFLTANSRAPEVNLFNLPKVCLWPLPDASRKSVANANAVVNDTRSPIDRLIAFCSTLAYDDATKKREYAFTRYDSTSATGDFAATDAYGTPGNQIIYNYLYSLLGRPLPGFGGSFLSRYGSGGSQQILTGVFDFIRAQTNLIDTSYSSVNLTSSQNLDGQFVSRYAYAANITAGSPLDGGGVGGAVGEVIPASLPNGTRGGGRFPVVSQVAIEFIARAANQPPVAGSAMHPWVPSGTSLTAYPTFDTKTDTVATTFDAARPEDFQTHPGLSCLTIANSASGPFNISNPRYRGPALSEYQTEIEPSLLVAFSIPGAGIPGFRDKFKVRVRGLQNLRVNGVRIFPSYDSRVATIAPGSAVWQFNVGPAWLASNLFFLGNGVIVGPGSDSGQTFPFEGGQFTIELINQADDSVVQTYNLSFPPATLPIPLLPNPLPSDNRSGDSNSLWSGTYKPSFPAKKAIDLPPSSLLTSDTTSVLSITPNYPSGISGYAAGKSRRSTGQSTALANMILPQWPVGNDYRGKLSSDTVRSLEAAYGDVRLLTQLGKVPSDFFLPHRFYFDAKMRAAHSFRENQHESSFEQMQGTTLQYLTASSSIPGFPTYAGGNWKSSDPNPGNLWDVATGEDVQRLAYSIFVVGSSANTISDRWPFTASTSEFDATKFMAYKNSNSSLSSVSDFSTIWSRGGDFSSGSPGLMDGPLLGKVDEGNNRIVNRGLYPYFNDLATTSVMPVGPFLFSPNRQVPSPVVLGSIPAGYRSTFDFAAPRLSDVTPWRTLLFSPNPVSQSHEALAEVSPAGSLPQSNRAPDFTLLDFFWMPVVEPYAVSEPLSTAGKVNMNTQIAPFTYINRDSALRGVFRSTLITAVPDKWLNNKNTTGSASAKFGDIGGSSGAINYANFRYPINADETLKQFQARFQAGDIFRSASEICSLWLYPGKRSAADASGPSWDSSNSAIKNWWYNNPGTDSKSVTGDNLREKPYATLYPLLTTKSNTYTVHLKVQTLQKVPGTAQAEWVEGRDRVTSEYQGSQTIERYVDPVDAKLIDFASKTTTGDPTTSDFYRFRVLSNKRFTP